ncbi:MAG: diacylglycerol kinase family lipid kinase [Anaerolineales bacterium]|nr:diacylglycerol kinase family lipid kinase [Anaerolineales bacterium]
MHEIRMIYNPEANRGRSYQIAGDLRHLSDEWGGADWIGTDYPGHACDLAAEAARRGYSTVAALGGDGTVHEVINGLMQVEPERRPNLGVVPLGSGNDFAAGVGVPPEPAAAVHRICKGGEFKPVDLGQVRDAAGRIEYWCNVLGIGFDAAINLQSRTIPWLRGFWMYLAAILKTIVLRFERPRMEIEMDGERTAGKYLMLTIGNGAREGGGFRFAPGAEMNDGWLDYLRIDSISRLGMLRLLPEVMRGTHGRFPCVRLGRFRSLRLRADRALPIQADGEMFAPYEADVRSVEVNVVPQALRVAV